MKRDRGMTLIEVLVALAIVAITLTAGILGGMLMLYYHGALRATPFLTKAIGASMVAILVAYLATWIGRMFGYEIPYIHGNGIIGIGFSLFVVGVASFSFILDFAQIEAGREQIAQEWHAEQPEPGVTASPSATAIPIPRKRRNGWMHLRRCLSGKARNGPISFSRN